MNQYLLEKLSVEDAEAFEVHVFGCEECLEELRIREQTIKILEKESVARVGISYSNKQRLKRNWGYAAGVSVAFFLIILFSIKVIQKDPAKINMANFEVNSYLEDVILQTYQSGDFSVFVQSPALGKNFKGDILFRWEVKKDGKEFVGPFYLKIMNNKQAVILNKKNEANQYEMREKLKAGLYYWTLEYQNEMLYLGKFFVKKPDNLFILPPK